MNYKFLIGARRAGVMLVALVMLGVSGAWAATADVTVNLADITTVNGAVQQIATGGTGSSVAAVGPYGEKDIFGVWYAVPKHGTNNADYARVTASFKWNPATGSGTAAKPGWYDSTLVLKVDASADNVDNITIKGTLKTDIRVNAIVIKDVVSGKTVLWDGGVVVGKGDKTGEKNGTAVDTFLTVIPAAGGYANVFILSGTLDGYAKYILRGVTNTKLASGSNTIGLVVGADNTAALTGLSPDGRSLSIITRGTGGAAIGGTDGAPLVINTPSNGTYTISGTNSPALASGKRQDVTIGTKDGTTNNTTIKSSGNGIVINGYTAGATPPAGSAAIVADGEINIYYASTNATTEKVVVRSRGEAVLSTKGDIKVYGARLEHGDAVKTSATSIPTVALSTGGGAIKLENAKVFGFTADGAAAVGTQLQGMIAQTSSTIEITEGSYAPAWVRAIGATDVITLDGVKLSAKGKPEGPSAVVTSGSSVTIKASNKDAEVAYSGETAFPVHGIVAATVTFGQAGSFAGTSTEKGVVGVKIDAGKGSGIVAKDVNVWGVSKDQLDYISVKDGRAIESYESDATDKTTAPDHKVSLRHVTIGRTGTPDAALLELVYVIGGDVDFRGVNSSVDASKGTGSVAILAGKNPNSILTAVKGGSVKIDGGKITGDKYGVDAVLINVSDDAKWVSDDAVNHAAEPGKTALVTVIVARTDAGLRGQTGITVNNAAAVVRLSAGTAGSAAIKATQGGIVIYNADSIYADGAGAAGLLAIASKPSGEDGSVNLLGGKVVSMKGTAILADGNITVNQRQLNKDANGTGYDYTAAATANPVDGWFGGDGTTASVIAVRGLRAANVVTNAGTAYAGAESKLNNVFVGWGTVTSAATSSGGPAIRVINGYPLLNPKSDAEVGNVVIVDDVRANIESKSGNGIYVENGNVLVVEGQITSGAATVSNVNFAAINVKNGNVRVSQAYKSGGTTKDEYIASGKKCYLIASGSGAIGIYVQSWNARSEIFVDKGNITGDGGYDRTLAGAVIDVKNTSANAGAIVTSGDVTVKFYGDITADLPAQKSFGIKAGLGSAQASDPITIGNYAKIVMTDGPAVTDTNINIILKDRATITGKTGVLINLTKRANTVKKFSVTVDGVTDLTDATRGLYVYSYKGPVIKSVDSVIVEKGTVKTDLDTAILAGAKIGTVDYPGYVLIKGGHVWAGGQNETGSGSAKKLTFAVAAKHVEFSSGLVEANTAVLSSEDEERYANITAVGILIPGPAYVSGGADLKISGDAKIVANGASIGVMNRDSLTDFRVGSYDPTVSAISGAGESIKILAGHGGTGIWSVGTVRISGNDRYDQEIDEDFDINTLNVRVKAGNGPAARAISIPNEAGRLTPTLNVDGALIEAGDNGAIAVASGANVKDSLAHSVVFARSGATAVQARGGVKVVSSYIEVLGNANDTSGTAIEAKGINISGGNELNGEDGARSEVHSKGIAVIDASAGSKIQVTGTVFMSGTIGSYMDIGSSSIGDSAMVTVGGSAAGRPEASTSRDLWKLSAYSDLTTQREGGKRFTIPAGVKVKVNDNKSWLRSFRGDTVKVNGTLEVLGVQSGAKFINDGGKTIVGAGGNVKFDKADLQSFSNKGGTVVLKAGSKLNDSTLVHDTGANITRSAYTFLKWADTLSGASNVLSRSRGPGKVVVPPLYAALDGDQSKVIDQEIETSKDKWNAFATRTDTVYTIINVDYPLDKRYANYLEDADNPAKGDYKIKSDKADEFITVDEDSSRVFTLAGTFSRTAKITNEAGTSTRVYTHNVLKTPYRKIAAYQAEDNGGAAYYFEGIILNADGKRVPASPDAPEVSIREGGVQVLYTGDANHRLIDRVEGGNLPSSQLDVEHPDRAIKYNIDKSVPTFWYEGADEDTRYQLSSNTPVNKGKYKVYASFAEGTNFEAVPSDPSKVVYIGQVEIVEGNLESVFGYKDSKYDISIKLEAKRAYNNVNVALLNLIPHGAKYNTDNLTPTGSGSEALVENSARLSNDSTLVFSVNNTTEYNQVMVFTLPIDPSYGENFNTDQQITVTVKFVTASEMKEARPEITVNYKDGKLTGFKAGAAYTINGATRTPTTDTIAIASEWEGTTLKVVKLAANSYTQPSDTANVKIATRQTTASEAVLAVRPDSSSTALTPDGALFGTKATMEYKLTTSSTWITAGDLVTRNLLAGTYEIREAATDTSFAGPSATVKIAAKAVSVAESNREVPKAGVTAEGAVAPVKVAASLFSAGPSPVSKSQGEINFFSSKTVKTGTLYIFDANGKTVAKAKASGTGKIAGAKVGKFAEGTYVVKGVLVGKDGTKDKVSTVFSVVK